jgi:hypothetical protein
MANEKRYLLLGMPLGTASNRLRKSLLFFLVKKLNLDICFQCKMKIENESELSIEHMQPWQGSDDPKGKFFDLSNIAFSHLKCNVDAGGNRQAASHGSVKSYMNGCRCKNCCRANTRKVARYRRNKKQMAS